MKFLQIKNQTEEKAEIYIHGDIVDDSWNWGWEDDPSVYPLNIKEMLNGCKGKAVDIHINSGGGHVFAGMAISNMIAQHDGHTTAIIDGLAGSIAGVIAMGCDEIYMPSNAYLMIHKPSCGCYGDSEDMLKAAEMLDTLQEGIVNSYLKHTKDGVTKEIINEKVNAETWFTGESAQDIFHIKVTDQIESVACTGDFFRRLKNKPKMLAENRSKSDKQEEEARKEQQNKEIDIALAIY